MASISYEDIYSMFLSSVTDYHLINLDASDIYDQFKDMIHKTAAEPYVRRLFSSISLHDQILLLEYEMKKPTNESEDRDFVINLFAKGMIVEWIQPQVTKTSLTAQMFAGKEQKFYSQKEMLNEMQSLLSSSRIAMRRMITERDFIYNSYLEDA